MKNRSISAIFIVLGLVVGIVTGFFIDKNENTQVAYAENDFQGIREVIPDYTGRDPATEGPYSFIFNPDANTPQYKWYKQLASWIGVKEIRFYEELYRGKFLWYSKAPPYNAKEYDKDMTTLYENKLRLWGTGGSCNGLPCH